MPTLANTKSDDPRFRGLVDPYTGKPVTVTVVVGSKTGSIYFSPDAFSPGEVCPTSRELLEKAGTRDGVIGALTGADALRCPYTGKPMTLVHSDAGFSLAGGFDPRIPCRSREDFEYKIKMRGGKAAPGTSPAKPVVAGIKKIEENFDVRTDHAKISDAEMEVADRFAVSLRGKEAAPVVVYAEAPKKEGR